MAKNLFFIGFMGSGKTTVSKAFAEKYNRQHIEADDIIAEREKMSIKDIFATRGEPYYRDLEMALCWEVAALSDRVISCGGGMPVRPLNVEFMKRNGFVILLEAKPETILARVQGNDSRPLLNGHMNVEYIAQMKEKRASAYAAAADITIVTDNLSVDEVVEAVYEGIHRAGQSSF